MAKITAEFDFFSPLWESEESINVFENGTDEEKREWMLAKCKLEEPKEIMPDEFWTDEELVTTNDQYTIGYYDYGFIEGVRLIEF